MTEVAIALIRRGDRFFIAQRPAHKARGLMWEFVGGKLEPGETGPEALVRECREELDARVSVGGVFLELTHTYPDMTVHLTLYHAFLLEEPKRLEHNDLRWVTPAEMDDYSFCPADGPILQKIQETYGSLNSTE